MVPNVLTIAGIDPSGGAGIYADLKTFSALGAYGMGVVTALTAQNTQGVTGVQPVPVDFIAQQIDTLLADVRVDAVKLGMLGTPEIARTVAAALRRHNITRVVVDPVMVAKSGHHLLAPEAVDALRREIVPLAEVLTPNLPEAEVLLANTSAAATAPAGNAEFPLGRRREAPPNPAKRNLVAPRDAATATAGSAEFPLGTTARSAAPIVTERSDILANRKSKIENSNIASLPDMRRAARALLALGPRIVMLKGGHLDDPAESPDIMDDGARQIELPSPRIATKNTHGTGCTLSAAIAALLPQRPTPHDAIRDAKTWLTSAIAASGKLTVGAGHGPVHHFWNLWRART